MSFLIDIQKRAVRYQYENTTGHRKYTRRKKRKPKTESKKCGYRHVDKTFPEKGPASRKCLKIGHFKNMCRRKKTICCVKESARTEDDYYRSYS